MNFLEMMKNKVHVYDARGHKIAWVRSAEEVEGGVFVRILVPILQDGELSKCALSESGRVLEASCFIHGGTMSDD